MSHTSGRRGTTYIRMHRKYIEVHRDTNKQCCTVHYQREAEAEGSRRLGKYQNHNNRMYNNVHIVFQWRDNCTNCSWLQRVWAGGKPWLGISSQKSGRSLVAWVSGLDLREHRLQCVQSSQISCLKRLVDLWVYWSNFAQVLKDISFDGISEQSCEKNMGRQVFKL